jgi:transcriptional regulator with PAS, ATPase and Fis domain
VSRFRSILWVGRPEPLGAELVADSPSVEVAWTRTLDEALELPLRAFDALVIEATKPEATADALPRLGGVAHRPRVVVLLAAEAHEHAARLRAAGADAVVLQHDPLQRIEELEGWLDPPRAPQPPLEPPAPPECIVARSPAMRRTLALVERARPSQATVLLTGETGTGKEVLARAVHSGSPRRDRPFVAVNCAAFPDTLLESELFGHTRGSFTGADRDKKGLFELAEGGVLFLDEVGETSPTLQVKLLRVLQEREVRAVGGTRARRIDVRLIAATNRDLGVEVKRGGFREDLYYRLAVFPITVPPLRERREDVLPLAQHFLALHGEREGKPGCRLSARAAELLLAFAWPGNVRELENEMQRCVALAESGETIDADRLSERITGAFEPVGELVRPGETLHAALDRLEAWLIRHTLDENAGRRAATARQLGVTREGLYKKMKRLNIT